MYSFSLMLFVIISASKYWLDYTRQRADMNAAWRFSPFYLPASIALLGFGEDSLLQTTHYCDSTSAGHDWEVEARVGIFQHILIAQNTIQFASYLANHLVVTPISVKSSWRPTAPTALAGRWTWGSRGSPLPWSPASPWAPSSSPSSCSASATPRSGAVSWWDAYNMYTYVS